MKESTKLYAKLESRGYPDKTRVVSGTLKEVILKAFAWTQEPGLYMGSKLVITMARSEAELDKADSKDTADLEAELDALMNPQAELSI